MFNLLFSVYHFWYKFCENLYIILLLGLIGTWEQRKLGEYGYFYYGKSAPKWSVTETATTPCVRYGELYTKFGEKIDKIYSYTNRSKDNLKFSTGNEVLVPRVGEDPLDFANCSWLSIPNVAIGEMISVYNTEENPLFISYYFNSQLKREFAKRVEGGSISNLYFTYLENILISIPDKEEQDIITNFLDSLDRTIALHQRKLEKLQQVKKGMLQKMFPKNGSNVPEIRFTGFTNYWEQRKLGETVQMTMGQSPNGENYTENPSDHILVQGNADMKNGRVSPRVWTTQVTKTAEPNDIILSVRAPVGDVGKTDYPVVLGRGVAGIKGNAFIFQTLLRMKEIGFWTRYSSGSTFESINSADLKEALIQIPNAEEQTKIGSFFKHLDDTIALQQKQLDLLQQLKTAYLQKMFV